MLSIRLTYSDILYNIIILESFMSFCVTVTVTCVTFCDIMLTPNPKFKIRKINGK